MKPMSCLFCVAHDLASCPVCYRPGERLVPREPPCDCEYCDPDGELSDDGGALLCREPEGQMRMEWPSIGYARHGR